MHGTNCSAEMLRICASMQFKKNGHNGVLFRRGDNGWLRLPFLTEWRYNEVTVTQIHPLYI